MKAYKKVLKHNKACSDTILWNSVEYNRDQYFVSVYPVIHNSTSSAGGSFREAIFVHRFTSKTGHFYICQERSQYFQRGGSSVN